MSVAKLPIDFVDKMRDLLKDEMNAYLASYEEPRAFGLRGNTLKLDIEEFARLSPFDIEQVPWAAEGFYYHEGERPGKHPYYHAGLYYIQEPSAMAPVELLDIQAGERVLDLCAAPGGKSTQIAAKLQGTGVLVVNDNHSDRVKALVKNLELFGVRNAVVLNERPERMLKTFAEYFDKILIDAPCSGEGMFRKEEDMMSKWQSHTVADFAQMQRELLGQAAQMLAPGGTIVYSTCTFSPEENEAQIAEFLDGHSEFEVVEAQLCSGFSRGRPDWLRAPWARDGAYSERAISAVSRMVRLWPHRLKGEGHFAAVLRHRGSSGAAAGAPVVDAAADDAARDDAAARDAAVKATAAPQDAAGGKRSGRGASLRSARTRAGSAAAVPPSVSLEPLAAFGRELLRSGSVPGGAERLVLYGEHAYAAPEGVPELSGVKVVRPGWYIGSLHKGRFEPSHALAMGLRMGEAARVINLESSDSRVIRYLKGETLEIAAEEVQVLASASEISTKGYCLICIDGYSVGWGKWNAGLLKNEYPPGWRWT
jgi:NOL1/NOP2/sun family putative RNA methylase